MRIEPGSVVGRYTLERRVAQDGLFAVYLAYDRFGDEVILKVLDEEGATALGKARVLRDARAVGLLDHPGIARIYASGESDGVVYIATEVVRGTDLRRFITERGPLNSKRALLAIAAAAEALEVAHEAGVVHGELKPANLILTYDDQIKLVDFGLGRRRLDTLGDDAPSALATLGYLAPEQVEHGLADERSDIWALGCILFELCTGRAPFGGSLDADATIQSILNDDVELPASLRGGAIARIVDDCLRKSSFSRIGSARELALLAREAATMGPNTDAPPPNLRHSEAPRPASQPGLPKARRSLPIQSAVEPHKRSSSRSGLASQRPGASESSLRSGSVMPSGHVPSVSRSAPPPPLVAKGRIKGTAIRAGLAWFSARYGDRAIEETIANASSELQMVLRTGDPAFGIIASGWYELDVVGELLAMLERAAMPPDPNEFAQAIGQAIARDNVNGIYRSLFRLIASPALLEANVQRVWSTYLDDGVLSAKEVRRGEIVLTLDHWGTHHPDVCAGVPFVLREVLRSAGFHGLLVERTGCISIGAQVCSFRATYAA